MREGIYYVQFATSPTSTGDGLVVLKGGSVNGGDAGYLYTGSLTASAGALAGALTISRWNPGHTSVFGPLDNFQLVLNGTQTADGFEVSGTTPSIPGAQIKIMGRFLKAAA